MAIPDYQTLMLPLLKLAADGKEHTLRSAYEQLATQFNLSPDEMAELLPSGRQPTINNRVGWARTYLKKAGLLESPGRSIFRITSRGNDVLKTNPDFIGRNFLMQFPEFVEFQSISHDDASVDDEIKTTDTPDEVLESTYRELHRSLASELLERVSKCSPQFFENLVVTLLVAIGYGGSREEAGKSIGKSGDGGIEGIINEDRLGLDIIYIQAKRWSGNVGEPIVREFAGRLEGRRAKKGVLITTSGFSDNAKVFVKNIEKKIVLIDGPMLADLMIEHNVGVNTVVSYEVKKVDSDFFADE